MVGRAGAEKPCTPELFGSTDSGAEVGPGIGVNGYGVSGADSTDESSGADVDGGVMVEVGTFAPSEVGNCVVAQGRGVRCDPPL